MMSESPFKKPVYENYISINTALAQILHSGVIPCLKGHSDTGSSVKEVVKVMKTAAKAIPEFFDGNFNCHNFRRQGSSPLRNEANENNVMVHFHNSHRP